MTSAIINIAIAAFCFPLLVYWAWMSAHMHRRNRQDITAAIIRRIIGPWD